MAGDAFLQSEIEAVADEDVVTVDEREGAAGDVFRDGIPRVGLGVVPLEELGGDVGFVAQFEVGREFVGDGVIRDPLLRAQSVHKVATAAASLGLSTQGVVASPLPGPSGNVEFFLWLKAAESATDTLDSMISRAIEEGPQ